MAYANDLPLLVAPRPVRITSSSFFARSRHVTVPSDDRQRFLDADHDDIKLSFFSDDKDISSPRASPRYIMPITLLLTFVLPLLLIDLLCQLRRLKSFCQYSVPPSFPLLLQIYAPDAQLPFPPFSMSEISILKPVLALRI